MEVAGVDWRMLALDARADGLAWEARHARFAETLGLPRG